MYSTEARPLMLAFVAPRGLARRVFHLDLSGEPNHRETGPWHRRIGRSCAYNGNSRTPSTRYSHSYLTGVLSRGWLELGGVVSGVRNPDSGVRAPGWRPRHDQQYHDGSGRGGRGPAFRQLV